MVRASIANKKLSTCLHQGNLLHIIPVWIRSVNENVITQHIDWVGYIATKFTIAGQSTSAIKNHIYLIFTARKCQVLVDLTGLGVAFSLISRVFFVQCYLKPASALFDIGCLEVFREWLCFLDWIIIREFNIAYLYKSFVPVGPQGQFSKPYKQQDPASCKASM